LFTGFALLVSIVAGLFPALYLSKISPLKSLGNLLTQDQIPVLGFRKVLLGIQFVLAILFGITTINVYRQSVYLENSDYGFEQDNIVNIKLQGNDYYRISKEISEISGVKKVSCISHLMGIPHDRKIGVRINPKDDQIQVENYCVDKNYLENLKLGLVAGKNFSGDLPIDRELYAIVNENFLDQFQLGKPADALGKIIILSDTLSLAICGVLKDFHFKSFIQPIADRGTITLRSL
jgi:putative ABC transport system permease protein